jgi:glyoxylase-like metal-dependent hydrolase (beta-lactamase superfamily II)
METRFGPVMFIPGDNNGNYPCCNSLYVEGDTKVLIDPASNRDQLQRILDTSGVDAVWLSHWHEDHFMHLDMFEGKDLWISELDAEPLQSLDHFFDAYGMNTDERPPWTKTIYDTFHFRPRAANRFIRASEFIDLGGTTIEVILTPGHTPGHTALYFLELGILFLGDYDLTAFGPWYGDARSDLDATIKSVNKLRTIEARLWIASHGVGIYDSLPPDMWDRYLSVIDERDEKLLDFLKEPRTLSDIVEKRIVYRKKREPKEFYDFGERAIMNKHLERFIRRGLVAFDGSVYQGT